MTEKFGNYKEKWFDCELSEEELNKIEYCGGKVNFFIWHIFIIEIRFFVFNQVFNVTKNQMIVIPRGYFHQVTNMSDNCLSIHDMVLFANHLEMLCSLEKSCVPVFAVLLDIIPYRLSILPQNQSNTELRELAQGFMNLKFFLPNFIERQQEKESWLEILKDVQNYLQTLFQEINKRKI